MSEDNYGFCGWRDDGGKWCLKPKGHLLAERAKNETTSGCEFKHPLAEIAALRERLAAVEAGCENSQNEDACGDCVHCLRVGMTAALDARAGALSRAETAEATVAALAAVVRAAVDAARLRLFIATYDGFVLDQPRGLSILDALDAALSSLTPEQRRAAGIES